MFFLHKSMILPHIHETMAWTGNWANVQWETLMYQNVYIKNLCYSATMFVLPIRLGVTLPLKGDLQRLSTSYYHPLLSFQMHLSDHPSTIRPDTNRSLQEGFTIVFAFAVAIPASPLCCLFLA